MTTKKDVRLKVTAEVELVYPVEMVELAGLSEGELTELVKGNLDELFRDYVYNDEDNVEREGYYSTAHKLTVEPLEDAEVSEV